MTAAVPAARARALHELWRAKQLQYLWTRTFQDAYEDFETVTATALDFALETLDLKSPGLKDI